MPGWKNPHFLSAWKRRILINFHCSAPCVVLQCSWPGCMKHQNYTSIGLNLSHLRVEFFHSLWVSASWICCCFLFCPLDFNETLKLAWPGQFWTCTPGRFNLPIMIVASRFAVKEQQKSLKSSSVKLAARDVAPRTNWAAAKNRCKQCRKEILKMIKYS